MLEDSLTQVSQVNCPLYSYPGCHTLSSSFIFPDDEPMNWQFLFKGIHCLLYCLPLSHSLLLLLTAKHDSWRVTEQGLFLPPEFFINPYSLLPDKNRKHLTHREKSMVTLYKIHTQDRQSWLMPKMTFLVFSLLSGKASHMTLSWRAPLETSTCSDLQPTDWKDPGNLFLLLMLSTTICPCRVHPSKLPRGKVKLCQ